MLNIEKVKIVANLHKRQKDTAGDARPTDDEVVAAVEVSYALIDIGNILGLEMLSAWAVMNYQNYNGIAWARGIQDKIKTSQKTPIEKS